MLSSRLLSGCLGALAIALAATGATAAPSHGGGGFHGGGFHGGGFSGRGLGGGYRFYGHPRAAFSGGPYDYYGGYEGCSWNGRWQRWVCPSY
jgi:hypothetical protein